MTKLLFLAALISNYPLLAQTPAPPARPNGSRLFDQVCTTCHGNATVERAPAPAELRSMTPEKVYEALTTGAMQVQAKDLADDAKRAIAEYLGDRKLGASQVADSKLMPNQCAGNPPLADISSKPAWNGWSMDLANTLSSAKIQSAIMQPPFSGRIRGASQREWVWSLRNAHSAAGGGLGRPELWPEWVPGFQVPRMSQVYRDCSG